MRFKKLTVANFGPFKDTEVVDFTKADGVSIIWGDNGRGKTSLLNAFNFVLFNIVRDRNGKIDNFISYINIEGFKEGNYTYRVSLDIANGTESYKVTRNLVLEHGVTVPQINSDVRTTLSVSHNGIIVDKDTGEHIIMSLITPEVSRFFLFDGELLEEYETLLDENSPTGGSIKGAIEQILGLPVLTYGFADVKTARDKIATTATRIAQNDANTKIYATSIVDYEAEKIKQEEDRDRLIRKRDDLLAKKKQIQAEIDSTQKLRDLVARRTNIETAISGLEQQVVYLRAEVVELLKGSWKWMFTPTVQEVVDEIDSDISELKEKEVVASAQDKTIAYIQQAIDEVFCPVCDHEATEAEKVKLQGKIDFIRNRTVGLTSDEKKKLGADKSRLTALRSYLGTQDRGEDVLRKCNTINDLLVKISDKQEHELVDVKAEIKDLIESGGNEDAVAQIMKRAEDCGRELQITEDGIKAENAVIDDLATKIEKTNRKLIQVSQNRDVKLAGKRKDFASSVASIFEQGIITYREKLRRNVECDATKIFQAMNTEDDYDRLEINDNYGLAIVLKSSGELVPKSSAGWIHMVAFALIGALHKNAPFEGPVIMDSPFNRMSTKNTANMVKALPLISKQVLLLPLPGEIDDQRTRQDIGDSIIQEKELIRISATHSKIKELM
ncbi:AAA family ATPase [Clostridium sp. KNHs216]|uniref:AAA family ATPase n=1 Tax=Clostridium sp. KNHs216 TaxID=1550235 RepID=UPI001153D928|nr:AAA family ATPase [Clostridium sp. KNHs216]TQI67888.1 DNA sulfur modification protein DndD [Clostridium sp. KNHs216]